MTSASLLQKVAAHELALLETRDDALEQARKIVEAAHVSAAACLQKAHTALDAEIAEQRKAAATARDAERVEREQACAAKVAQIRSESESRLDTMREALLAQVLPR